ncbi:MAG: family 78 glycoside hydrolase catalytic domain [Chitinophagaceae bacterium]
MKRSIAVCFFLCIAAAGFPQAFTADGLRCEYKQDPQGIETPHPQLGWQLRSAGRNVLQTAYRILVADDPALLQRGTGNMWDSRKIVSGASLQVPYQGKALLPAKKYFWKVMVWDNHGNTSAWSNTASWQMGLPEAKDWAQAQWIAYDVIHDTAIIAPHVHLNGKKSWGTRRNVLPLLRKRFTIQKPIKSATAFICGLGHFELSINGEKAGDHFLDPGWTDYRKQALYVVFDLTHRLRQGDNAIGVMLGNGFFYIPGQRYRKMTGAYGLPKMIMRTVIEYTDGTVEDIVSDQSWKTAASPVIFSSIFGGEDYDAGLEQPAWNTSTFDDSRWRPVMATTGPAALDAQTADPVKVMEKFRPVAKQQVKPGTWVFDLGQNFSGIPALTVRGNKGDTVRIYGAELINDDGTANQRATGSPSYFTYILKGSGQETWQPRFSYTGFRYLEVRCLPADSHQRAPQLIDIEGWHVRNATAAAGSFACSNPLFNRIDTLIDWAVKSNMVSLFTDCPHREKLGWLEQTYLMGSSVHYGYDIALLNRKMIADMMQAQYPDGRIPEIVPEFTAFTPPFDESPEWGSAAIILPWYHYQWYGDKQTLTESYDMMKRYVRYLQGRATDNILSHGLGDWYDLGPNRPGFPQMTKAGVTATATWYYALTIMEQVAKLLGKPADEKEYRQQAATVKTSFNQRFFDPQRLQYDSASQTANAIALFTGLAEPQHRAAVLSALVQDLHSRNYALTAGDIGFRYVLRTLEQAGRNDVIFAMNNRDDVPGYGYQLKNGATALTESWQALPVVSNNHFMLGHLMEWFYSGLVGIRAAGDAVAFNKIIIDPGPVGNMDWARAAFQSPYGLIASGWKKQDGLFELEVEIPANTTAVIYLPATSASVITESGRLLRTTGSVRIHGFENGKARIRVGSGQYHFSVKN